MYRIFLSVLTIVIILSTLCISIKNPPMHKSVMIYDTGCQIVQPEQETTVTKNMPAKNNVQQVQKTFKNVETPVVTTKTIAPQKTLQTEKQVNTAKHQNAVAKTTQASKKTTITAPVQKQITQQNQIRETEREIILWNKWRSDLQNRIMKDTILPIMPEGTVFKFTFDVDKYGKISNVQAWSTNPAFTPYAIQYIAPVIKSYQGRDFLNFPQGSIRTSTTVEGGWRISQTSKYSTPNDFKDAEKVIK